jgi:hypothetical protein
MSSSILPGLNKMDLCLQQNIFSVFMYRYINVEFKQGQDVNSFTDIIGFNVSRKIMISVIK